MNVLWPLSGIKIACIFCKQELHIQAAYLSCESCCSTFPLEEGTAKMLTSHPTGAASEEASAVIDTAHKQAVQDTYDSINRSLEEKGFSRFSTFINWGYVDAEIGRKYGFHGFNRSFVRLLFEVVGGQDMAGKDVLEIGCGRGGNVNELCKSYGAGSAIGLDLTPSNIHFCNRSNRYEQAYYCIGDAEQLPIQSECCDYVLNVESSHLYPCIERFFNEVFRVLKPGGRFLYADIMEAVDVSNYKKIWKDLGFRIALTRDITANVLLSGEESFNNRLQLLGGSFESADGTLEWLEAPGTQKHQDMIEGKRMFQIFHLVKEENSCDANSI